MTGAAAVCARHLDLLGVRAPGTDLAAADDAGRVDGHLDRSDPEPVLQALTGLMAVHGRDQGAPRRLGLDVASVTTGLLAAQGLLAALVARRRGLPVTAVDVPAPAGAVQLIAHHLAIATSGGTFPFGPAADPGPPFRTADGVWIELEVLSGHDWRAFWRRLGLEGADVVGAAWLPYVYRYLAGTCALPPQLAAAVSARSLAEVRTAATASGAAVAAVRTTPHPTSPPPWTISPHDGPQEWPPVAPGDRPVAPLDGLVVVEVTSRLQGPLAGMLLRRLGAEVIKVEPPGGDFGRPSPPLAGDTSAAYLAYNAGKRVTEVDYKHPSGRAALRELAAGADVFLHNWRPGRAASLGLDSADLARVNPRLVYAYASGWGGAADAPGSIAGDFIVQAYAGTGALLHQPGAPPLPSRLTLVDVTGGLLAAAAVVASLHRRETTGRGQRADTSLTGAAAALASARHTRWTALDRPIRTIAGHLVVPVALPADRETRGRMASRPAAESAAELTAAGVPAAAVREDLAGMPADPRLAGLLERAGDACWIPATPWRFHV